MMIRAVLCLVLLTFVAACTQSQEASLEPQIVTTYRASNENFSNPERGWAESINPGFDDAPAPPLNLEQLQTLRDGPDKVTLIRKYYLLKAFLDAPLSQAFLDAVRADFAVVRQAGMKLVPRFVYTWNPSVQAADAPVSRVLEHLEQLRPVLAENVDVTAFVETGLVGHYGEWHDSSNNHVDNFSLEVLPTGLQIRNKLLQVVPRSRMIAMRYFYWHKMKFWPTPLTSTTAFGSGSQARIGLHDDALMSESSWQAPSCGECPAYEVMLEYLKQETNWVVQFGEPLTLDGYSTSTDPRPALAQAHYSGLVRNANSDNNAVHYQYWREQGYYSDLTRSLGYRFQLVSSSIPTQVSKTKNLVMSFDIKNVGYAAPYNPRRVELILRDKISKRVYTITLNSGAITPTNQSYDPRFWQANKVTKVSVNAPLPSAIPAGSYDLLLNFPDPTSTLRKRPEYSMRLANQAVWEVTTGYNALLRSITVNP